MKEIYLDNASTTKPLKQVADAVADIMINIYGNPSSLHKKGIEAETIIKNASVFLAKVLGCAQDEMIYTSGGTESNNMAIIGTSLAYRRRGNKIITTAIEHPSVLEPFKYLKSQGFEICMIPVSKEGYIDLEALEEAIDEQTILVSIMHVNNEIGTVQPLEQIGTLIKQKHKETLFHVDAVQSFSKIPIHVKKDKIDLLSVSAHKFYGPRGIGFLYKSKQVRLNPLIYGGGQQKDLRSGTENTPGIAGMLEACKYVTENKKQINAEYLDAKTYLANEILAHIPDTFINGPSVSQGAPHILNIGFRNVRAEVLLHALEHNGIYVSSGSACASNKKSHSHALMAIGNHKDDFDNAIRFSFGLDITKEDLDNTLQVLKEQVALLRRYTLGGKQR
ncbi:cysteine desulfurase family protein [Cellulosilyticum sp. I15G10I2]|uniref:cysteine desulfurase family protein n=1 Tax=Cellulosilyticum sp. I15G10I2 TaxID=1892843 RepID=UPI00085C5983|nr:cysteine desulfurase family protein [Cellulosilyticum sp. I15G10I2]